jgi:hypothetical protein
LLLLLLLLLLASDQHSFNVKVTRLTTTLIDSAASVWLALALLSPQLRSVCTAAAAVVVSAAAAVMVVAAIVVNVVVVMCSVEQISNDC